MTKRVYPPAVRHLTLHERIARSSASPDANGCIEWLGYKKRGYGTIKIKGKWYLVTRAVLEAKLGRPILPKLMALHTCNNPACVAAAHLYEGTGRDNAKDRSAHGVHKVRVRRGTKHPNAVLTPSQVRAIRRSSETYSALSRKYGVSVGALQAVREFKTWAHVK